MESDQKQETRLTQVELEGLSSRMSSLDITKTPDAGKEGDQEEHKQPRKTVSKREARALRRESARNSTEQLSRKQKTKPVKEPAIEPEDSATQTTAPTPALLLLAGDNFEQLKKNRLIDTILNSIDQTLAAYKMMVLRGRALDNYRIEYHPQSTNITSIRSRMTEPLSSEIDYDGLETLLLPLISTNRIVFGAQNDATLRGRRLDERSYRSFWIHHQKLHEEIRPINLVKRDTVVAEVVVAMRELCERVDGSSLLLQDPMELGSGMAVFPSEKEIKSTLVWSLHGTTYGLAFQLRKCFDGQECGLEEFEDRIERVLYLYKSANHSAIYGAKATS